LGQTLKERISRLDLGPEGKQLVEDLEKLRDDLETTATGLSSSWGRRQACSTCTANSSNPSASRQKPRSQKRHTPSLSRMTWPPMYRAH
ncbi:AvrE-family type 3 secretion system effector, partial [Pseudomonas viridiflava]|uniref:AvrE-family type 3 secretion system effector n=1 Tax=Pseudomonas viridiflava TaxID=33069 RepID=UPI000F04FA11